MNLADTVRKLQKDVSTALRLAMKAGSGGGVVVHSHQGAGSGGTLDHGLAHVAASLLDDDHPYILASGTKALTGTWDAGAAAGRTIQIGNLVAGAAATAQEYLQSEGRLALKETSDPSSDANYGKLWVSSVDSVLYFMDDSGNIYDLLSGGISSPSMPRYIINPWAGCIPGNGVYPGIGANMTLQAAGAASNILDADGRWGQDLSSAVAGNISYLRGNNYNCFQPRHNPYLYFKLKTYSEINHVRLWVGASTNVVVRNATPNIGDVGFRFSTPDGDGAWIFQSRDAAGTTTTSTGVNVNPSTVYEFQLWTDDGGTTWYWDINGTSGSNTNNVPSTTASQGPIVGWIPESAAADSFLIGALWWTWTQA